MVHSSLSACGHIRGGALAVIRALRTWNGKLLAMPVHTYCYPQTDCPTPVFDPQRTASIVGTITDSFWRQPNVKRSLHPTHSLACEGAEAEVVVANHENCETPCGRGTPYERLISQDTAVLMFGVTMNSYTFFHTAEDAAAVPYLYEPKPVRLKMRKPSGAQTEMTMRRQDMSVARSFAEKDTWLQDRDLLRRTALGRGELLYIPSARTAHELLVEQLRCDPWFLASPGRVA